MRNSLEKILVAMSGGVDSSVAAALLKEQGHEVHGAYMKNWIEETEFLGECPWQQDIDDARAVAECLNIPFEVVNLMDEYKCRVVDYLVSGYENGETPNPDVMCNREVKFGAFLDLAIERGFDAVATGHYARLKQMADGGTQILEGLDANKDQSYFLALMKPEQIARARFPIGNMTKPEVRELAKKFLLPNASKKDSQGICFIGKVKMSDFLATRVPNAPGNIVNLAGEVLGRHDGLHFFTLGQRRGIGVSSNAYRENYVVVEKRHATRELVVAFDHLNTPGLYSESCVLRDLSFTGREISTETELSIRPRYRAEKVRANFIPLDQSRARLELSTPLRALTVGQVCALYDGSVLLGGGVYERVAAARKDNCFDQTRASMQH